MRLAHFSADGFEQTFVQYHKEFLNPKYLLEGSRFPKRCNGSLIPGENGIMRIFRRLKGEPPQTGRDRFCKWLKVHSPDILLAEFGNNAADILPECKAASVPMIVTFYGYDAFRKDIVEAYGTRYQELFNYAFGILVQSKTIKQALMDLGCAADKIEVNSCPPHPDFTLEQVVPSGKHFTSVMRFVDKKAPYLLLLSFRKVLDKQPDATLTIAGDGPLLASSRELSAALGMSNAVHFTGRISRAEQIQLFRDSLGYVQHSIVAESGDQEGIPVVILEAGAMGLPVISTRHSGIPEVVIEEKTGFLVEERDIEAFSTVMIMLIEQPDRAKRMGKEAMNHIRTNYTLEGHINRLNAQLKRALL